MPKYVATYPSWDLEVMYTALTKIDIDFHSEKECASCGKISTNCKGKFCDTGIIVAGLLSYGKT